MGSDRLLTIVKIFIGISIHAPRMGSDDAEVENQGKSHHFNPRPPHGERHTLAEASPIIEEFQSTPPAWGAKSIFCMPAPWLPIFQSTPPRMGSDPPHFYSNNDIMEFQSTLPAWGATSAHQSEDDDEPHISIHAPRMGSDINRGIPPHAPRAFQSTPPHGERRRSTRSSAKS